MRQHSLWKRIRIVQIRVEERVAVPDGRSTHLPVGKSLVGVVEHIVLTCRLRVLNRGQSTEFHLLDRGVLQFCLISEIENIKIEDNCCPART